MKIALTSFVLALSVTAPAFAESAAERFALDNDSAAERILGNTSLGDINSAQSRLALDNDSAAERFSRPNFATVTRSASESNRINRRSEDARAFFALSNDSAAERVVRRKY